MIEILDTVVLEISFTDRELSIHNANNVLPILKKAAALNNKNIELNFQMVDSIDSSAINMLVKFYQHMIGSQRALTLTHLSGEMYQTFEMVKLSRFFKIDKSRIRVR